MIAMTPLSSDEMKLWLQRRARTAADQLRVDVEEVSWSQDESTGMHWLRLKGRQYQASFNFTGGDLDGMLMSLDELIDAMRVVRARLQAGGPGGA